MKRREFITFLGGAAAMSSIGWPLVARAQQRTIPVIGYLGTGAPEQGGASLVAIRKGLAEMGFVEGRNVALDIHWMRSEFGRLPDLIADLLRRRPAVMYIG